MKSEIISELLGIMIGDCQWVKKCFQSRMHSV